MRGKMSDLITDVVFIAQELGLCLAKLKCEKRDECEVVKKSIELAEKVSELLKLQRQIIREARGS